MNSHELDIHDYDNREYEEEVIDTSEGPSDPPEYDNEDAYNPMYGKRFDDPNHPINTGD